MKDKSKRTWLIVLGVLVCVALVITIAGRFTSLATTDLELNDDPVTSTDPVVGIDTPENTGKPNVVVNIDDSSQSTDPAAGADSEGTEQTIQAAPVKPDAPENPTPVEDDHGDEDVPESERNTETPPTYAPEQTTVTTPSEPPGGSTNASGAVYVPGFGYIESSGEGTAIQDDSIYENGNKVGIMD